MSVFLVSCKKEPLFENKGVIKYQLIGTTICSSGYVIEIEGENYLFKEFPEDAGFSLEPDDFPVKVWLVYEAGDGFCSEDDDRIKVTEIALR